MKHKLIGLEHETTLVQLAVDNNFPVLLVGETGQGKTYLLDSVAKRLGKKCVRVSLNGEVGMNELVGKWLIRDKETYWQDGVPEYGSGLRPLA